jgi:hypothetical protein
MQEAFGKPPEKQAMRVFLLKKKNNPEKIKKVLILLSA